MSADQIAVLADVTTKIGSGSTPRGGEAAYKASGVPLIRSMNVHFDGFRRDGLAFLDDDQARALKNVEVRAGDVLLNITGASIGRVTVAPTAMDGARVNQHVCIIRPDRRLDSSYLRWHLASPSQQRLINGIESGATRQALTKEKILEFEVPLPPLESQREIVAEIEKQFSRLDEAVANLQRVKANLKRYTAAVLTAATEGTLSTVGDEAPERFEIRVDGASLNEQELTPLPASWCWSTAGAAIDAFEAGASFKCVERPPQGGEVGVLKVSALTWGAYDEQESKTCMDPSRVNLRYLVKPGDFLFSRANTIELVGACVIVGTVTKQLMLSDKTLRLRINPAVAPAWLQCCLRSKFGRAEIERLATGNQESMRNIGQARIRQIRMPLPPLAEQRRIVGEVDRRLSIVLEAEAEVDANLKRAQVLRQAVLVRSFSAK